MNKSTLNTLDEMYGKELDTSYIQHKVKNVAYGVHDKNKIDIYYPDDFDEKKCYPTIIFFHGGAFFKGNKERYQLLGALQGIYHGYAVVGVGYRLTVDAPYPAYNTDAFAVLRFLQAKGKEYNIDVDHLCLWGESSGAFQVVLAGFAANKTTPFDDYSINSYTEKASPKVIIDWYGPNGKGKSKEDIFSNRFGVPAILIPEDTEEVEACIAAEDIEPYLDETSPAILIQHGTADEMVPYSNSVQLYNLCKEHLGEEKVKLELIEGYHHGIKEFTNQENIDHIFEFINQNI